MFPLCTKVAEQRFYPWGQATRYTSGTQKTEYNFTGQRLDGSTDLLYYGARYYDPALRRWVQPDTLVPEPGNPQDLNRYTYVRNNPLKYTDPTGYIAEDEADEALCIIEWLLSLYGVSILVDFGWQPVTHPAPSESGQVWEEGAWELSDLNQVLAAVAQFADAAGGSEAAQLAIGGVAIYRVAEGGTYQYKASIQLDDAVMNQTGLRKELGPQIAVVHELAHYWDWKMGGPLSKFLNMPGALSRGMRAAVGGEPGPTWWARNGGFAEDWAESAAAYVIPRYTTIVAQEGEHTPGLSPLHKEYLNQAFSALTVEKVQQ